MFFSSSTPRLIHLDSDGRPCKVCGRLSSMLRIVWVKALWEPLMHSELLCFVCEKWVFKIIGEFSHVLDS
jgi:hypothetical protein